MYTLILFSGKYTREEGRASSKQIQMLKSGVSENGEGETILLLMSSRYHDDIKDANEQIWFKVIEQKQ